MFMGARIVYARTAQVWSALVGVAVMWYRQARWCDGCHASNQMRTTKQLFVKFYRKIQVQNHPTKYVLGCQHVLG